MAEPVAYFNGKFVPQSKAHLSLGDAGFVFGATATDQCRTFRHKVFRLDDHLKRFEESCSRCRVPLRAKEAKLRDVALELVEKNCKLIDADDDLVLVLFATPGEIGYYLGQTGGPGDAPPTLCLHTFPLPFGRYAPLVQHGAQLVIPNMNATGPLLLPAAKHRSRLAWWLAEKEAKEKNPNAAALLAPRGWVTETATANFLVVRDGTVYSPEKLTILRGISLMTAEDLCRDLDIGFKEVELKVQDWVFRHCQEAMLSSTPYGLAPVASIDGRTIATKGPVFKALMKAWNDQVGLDIHDQILRRAAKN